MNIEQIIEQVNNIFISVFDDKTIKLTPDTSADDIDDWDSLTHIQLIVATEKHFNIKFDSSEILNFKNVGDMCERIISRKNNERK